MTFAGRNVRTSLRAGETRHGGDDEPGRPEEPWRVGPADVCDDVRQAGAVIRELTLGRTAGGHPVDPVNEPPALRALVGDVVVDPVGGRRTAVDLSRRLQVYEDVVRGPDPGELVRPAQEWFDELEAAKLAAGPQRASSTRRRRVRPTEIFRSVRPARSAPEPPAANPWVGGGQGRLVRCPVCMDEFVWAEPSWLIVPGTGGGEPVEIDVADLDPEQREAAAGTTYVRCPNPHAEHDEHYLPAGYGRYSRPLVVAVVGEPAQVRADLVRTMTDQLVHGSVLSAYGLTAERLGPDLGDGALSDDLSSSCAQTILLGRYDGMLRPFTFIEISAADPADPTGRGLTHADALVYVHRPQFLRHETAEPDAATAAGAFLRGHDAARARPSAIVLGGAEGLRYVPPIDRWLGRSWVGRPLDPSAIRAESCDVFAYLHHAGQTEPVELHLHLTRCTLHATPSPTSRVADWRAGVEPDAAVKAAEPVIAILAMAGVVDGLQAQAVG